MTNTEEYKKEFDKKEYDKKYYLKNKKRILDRGKKWRSENKEWMKEYSIKYRCENKEELKRKKRIYNVKTREKRKEHYIKNREKRSEYRKKNARKYLNLTHKRRAKLKITDISIEWLNKLFYKTKKCSLCKCKLDNNGKKYPNGKQIDHIIPLSVGGEHMKYNVRIVCMKCNLERPKDGSDNLQLIINFKEAI
jgi:5-methylcytosine-specific restriction endonuclease McrA